MGQKNRPETVTMDDSQLAKHIAATTVDIDDQCGEMCPAHDGKPCIDRAGHTKEAGNVLAKFHQCQECADNHERNKAGPIAPAELAAPEDEAPRAISDEEWAKIMSESEDDQAEMDPTAVDKCTHTWQPHTRTGMVKLDHCAKCGAQRTA